MKDDSVHISQFTFEDFYTFYKNLTVREEVEKIFEKLYVSYIYIYIYISNTRHNVIALPLQLRSV